MTKSLPATYTALTAMLGLAVFINYVDRGMVGVAAPLIKDELALSATQFGIAVSAFSWTYAPAQPLIGWLADRMNVTRLLALGLALWGIATALTALVAGLSALVAMRVVLGIGESVAFPVASKLIATHIAPERRGSANAYVSAGLSFGPAFGTLACGLLMAGIGWRWTFAMFGMATLLWLIPWRRVAAALPPAPISEDAPQISFARVAMQPALWTLATAHFLIVYGQYFLLAWLPLYLVKERGYSLQAMAVIAACAYAAQGIAAIVTGSLTDRLDRSGWRPERARATVAAIGSLCCATGIAGIFMSSGTASLVAFAMLACIGVGIPSVPLYTLAQGFAGSATAGRWVGLQNGFGNVAGIIGPVVTGALIDATASYAAAFGLASVAAMLSALVFGLVMPPLRPVVWSAATP